MLDLFYKKWENKDAWKGKHKGNASQKRKEAYYYGKDSIKEDCQGS